MYLVPSHFKTPDTWIIHLKKKIFSDVLLVVESGVIKTHFLGTQRQVCCTFKLVGFPMSVPYEGYSRNSLYTLNLISKNESNRDILIINYWQNDNKL
jgi:hypothetical protein